ncbi:MAG: HDOD domain-containing protein [Deltaproteobacteria bacterium]|nr:HDOD domain-containing protein [Deltaproteobacteria bacterium]
MQTILIADRDREESRAIGEAIRKEYKSISIASPEEIDGVLEKCAAILLDHGFTEHSGFDFLMNVMTRAYLPVVMITPPDEPKCAVEAIRLGAQNYIVKTGNYRELLAPSVKEAIYNFNERQEMKRIITALKERVAELESELRRLGCKAPAGRAEKGETSLLKEIVTRFKRGEVNLPSYPEINNRFRELLEQGAGISQIAGLLRKDMGISTKLIGISNSPFYRGLTENKTLEQAIGRLGLVETKKYVSVISNRSLYATGNAKYSRLLNDLWAHSLCCAYAAEAFAGELKIPRQDELFTLGLLHDIGKLVLLQVAAEMETAGGIGNGAWGEELSVTIKAHHGSFGQALLKKWRFPESYGHVALYHDNIEKADSVSKDLQIVHLGNLTALHLGYGQKQPLPIDLERAASSTLLGMTGERIAAVQERVKTMMENATLA